MREMQMDSLPSYTVEAKIRNTIWAELGEMSYFEANSGRLPQRFWRAARQMGAKYMRVKDSHGNVVKVIPLR